MMSYQAPIADRGRLAFDRPAAFVTAARKRQAGGGRMNLLFWMPLACVLLHVTEEFFWPGGFSAWFRAYRPENALSFTPRFAFWINALLVAATLVLGVLGPTWSRGASLWLVIVAILGGNALFHIVGVVRMRRYSPGVVTGTLLYLPLCVAGYGYFLQSGAATIGMAVFAFALGASYELWTRLNHRRRSAAMSAAARK